MLLMLIGNKSGVIFSFWKFLAVVSLKFTLISLITIISLIIIRKTFFNNFFNSISYNVIDFLTDITNSNLLYIRLHDNLYSSFFCYLIQTIAAIIILILTEKNTIRPGTIVLVIIGTIIAVLLMFLIGLCALYVLSHIDRLYLLYKTSEKLAISHHKLLKIARNYNQCIDEYNEMNEEIQKLGNDLGYYYHFEFVNSLNTDNFPIYYPSNIRLLFLEYDVQSYCKEVRAHQNDVVWYNDRSQEQIAMMDVIIDKKQKLIQECNHTLSLLSKMSVPPMTYQGIHDFICNRFQTLSNSGKLEKKIKDLPNRSLMAEAGQFFLGDFRDMQREKNILEEDAACKRLDIVVGQMREFNQKIEAILKKYQTDNPELIKHLDELCGIHVDNLNTTVNKLDTPKKKKNFFKRLFGG